jgi:hypothetical protein
MSETNSRQDASVARARRAQCVAEIARHYQPLVPAQAYALDVFKPEDAPGIARLYYGAYGEHFPIDYVYDPAAIIARNANGDVRHLVARTEVGDVVGVGALFFSAPTKVMMEMGAFIVDPAYQGGRLVLKLAQITGDDLPGEIGLKAVLSQAVCDHLVTQKPQQRLGYRPFAIELAALPERRADRQFGVSGRISLLDGIRLFEDEPHTLFLPERYASWLTDFYAARGLQRRFERDTGPDGKTLDLDVQDYSSAGFARLTVARVGEDFERRLESFLTAFPEAQVWQLALPMSAPGCGLAVERAHGVGFFLAGVLALWSDHDMLLMQRLACPFDPDSINLLTDEAKRMLEDILADAAQAGADVGRSDSEPEINGDV